MATITCIGTTSTPGYFGVAGTMPSSVLNDVLLLVVWSGSNFVCSVSGTGWSADKVGGSSRLHLFWKRSGGGVESWPTISGAFEAAAVIGYRGCVTSGDPIGAMGSSVRDLTNVTSGNAQSVTAPGPCRAVFLGVAHWATTGSMSTSGSWATTLDASAASDDGNGFDGVYVLAKGGAIASSGPVAGQAYSLTGTPTASSALAICLMPSNINTYTLSVNGGAAVKGTVTASVGAGAAVGAHLSTSLQGDAAVGLPARLVTASADAAIQATRSASLSADVAVQATRLAQLLADAAVGATFTLQVQASAKIGRQWRVRARLTDASGNRSMPAVPAILTWLDELP